MIKSTEKTPAIALINPKYLHNIGTIIRTASCFNISQIYYTGERINKQLAQTTRIPREERMREYKDVALIHNNRIFDIFNNCTPVAVEVKDTAENLVYFKHPKNALYVFGPEDGTIKQVYLRHCHKFIFIPTAHCLNLATAVSIIMYDRLLKELLSGNDNRYDLNSFIKKEKYNDT